ncbi:MULTISPECIES: hypothetical protein [unclassified Streptomyces]|uniref:hypothetical protein n=1 Tax=unclassified Streptomyces TaxID=2593676 RepID=UPI0006FECB68|nr:MULTISPECIES: hypothetical protein [unclassified Streptomyces]KQX52846.1 hypothetical protein ASD33_06220 [Streptomyces sp. Root1304]KRA89761.1 hypothetical protein ASE09_06225 [Streptomyces sp. Root66D1]
MAAPAAAATAEATGTGTVVQTGGRPTFRVGSGVPVKSRFDVTLPAGVTGQVKARLVLPPRYLPMDSYPENVAGAVHSTVSVNGARAVPVSWQLPTDPGVTELNLVLDLPAVAAAGTLTYEVTFAAEDWVSFYLAPSLDGRFEVLDASATPVASGSAGFLIDLGTPARDMRGAFHARDKSGVLWRYESLGQEVQALTGRTRVGGGWGTYSLISRLTPTYANGRGDLLGRDKAGVLWYHQGSGNPAEPFKPRVRLGAGWNIYTAITGYGDGMLARDTSGALWNFRHKSGEPATSFEPRVRVGAGWNAYTAWTGTPDGVLTRDASGVLWKHTVDTDSTKANPFLPRVRVGGGWNTYNSIAATPDLGRWSGDDLVARDRNGDVWAYDEEYSAAAQGGVPGPVRQRIGWGWNIYDAIV